MRKVLVLGELLMRLTPPNNLRLDQTSTLEMYFGGAEANVAVGLKNLGVETSIISAVPNNAIGNSAKAFLMSYGVNCDNVVTKGDRLGLYYYEEGYGARSANVIYDRKNSSITEIEEDDLNFDNIFNGVDLLHVSGITFGLGENVRKISTKIINEAKKRDIKISVDLNYRAKLFESYEEFLEVLKPIVKDSYICFGWLTKNPKEFKFLDPSKEEVTDLALKEKFKYMTEELGVKYVATTLRRANALNVHSLTGVLYADGEIYRSSKYEFHMLSRIGGGDAFATGVLKKILDNSVEDKSEIIEFGIATAVLKHAQRGDISLASSDEIYSLINNKSLGSVNR
ncbi:sugar kinase [Clostridium sardiniense]|uniref:sugar kinase n=1 Tax=Clostridium sardiniense TaxID=29369 RepID=UPI00195ADD80|nr:sugar kinase [Clostridium sardiniense]MBM7834167.1 2-dehydro-3-deoxygluconokinase [Clostridium sardiniense]